MYKTGHYGISMLLYSPILLIAGVLGYFLHGIVGLGVVLFLTPVPDSDIQYDFLTHRGFTHSVPFAFLIGLAMTAVTIGAYMLLNGTAVLFPLRMSTVLQLSGLAVGSFIVGSLGILFHLLGDIITPMGIRPFQKPPLIPNTRLFSEKRYSYKLVYAKNQWANIGFFILGGIAIFCSLILIGVLGSAL